MTKKESKEPKKEPKFQPAKDKKDQLPPFPERNGGMMSDSLSGTGEDEVDDGILEEICSDLIAVPFEIWHLLKPEIPELTINEKKLISKPLARVAQKYDVQKYAKDEILLFGFLGVSILRRTRMTKKNDTNDSRKERERKDYSGKVADPGLSSTKNPDS